MIFKVVKIIFLSYNPEYCKYRWGGGGGGVRGRDLLLTLRPALGTMARFTERLKSMCLLHLYQ